MSKLTGLEMLEKIGKTVAEMEEVEKRGDTAIGTLVPYNTSHRSNRYLVDRFGNSPRWGWIGMLGGFMRIAEKATPVNRSMVDMKPGEWIDGGPDMKLPGFGGCDHAIHGKIKVRVSAEALAASKRSKMPSLEKRTARRMARRTAGAAPPVPPPDLEELKRMEGLRQAVRAVYARLGVVVPKATEDWLYVAGAEDMEAWLEKAGRTGGGK